MADYTGYTDNYDEIEFLESEIEEDDAEAPLGVLIVNDNGKVKPVLAEEAAAQQPDYTSEIVDEAEKQEIPAEETAPAEEEKEAEAVEEQQPATAEEPVAEQPAPEEEHATFGEDALSPETVAAYAIVYNPEHADAAVNAAMQQEETPAPAEEAAPVYEQPVVSEPIAEEQAPATEEPAPAVYAEPAAAETPAVEEQPAAKKAAPKKKAATVTIQKAASADDVWGTAVITTPKKSAPKKEKSDESAVKDNNTQTQTKAKTNTRTKEEEPVAKKEEKAPAKKTAAKDDAKDAKETKATAKTAKAPAAKSTAKAAPAAKTAKAKEEPKAAKPATKPAEPAEQVIEEGDTSAPHGKFVIKKTDNGNFVYKLYSSNHRVVAIGAGLYTSMASCKSGINSVRNNAESAPIEDQTLQKWEEKKFPKWQIYFDKKGEVRLRLLASNGNIVATTNDGYLSRDAAKKGIEAIARASKGSAIVRNDDLW